MLADRARERGVDVWTFGFDADTPAAAVDVTVADVSYAPDGTTATLIDHRTGLRALIRLPLVGVFNVANALAAATTARAAGYDLATVAGGLGRPVVVPGRFERVVAGQPFPVLVDYAHTPDALDRVLAAAGRLTGIGVGIGAGTDADNGADHDREHDAAGRLIVVFGCGGDRDPAKRPLMGRAVADRADYAVLTSDNPRSEDPQAIADAVIPGLQAGRAEYTVDLDRRSAIAAALAVARAGDVVVIAGKGHETGQTAGGHTIPFDDRAVAREELGALGWS